MSKEESHKIGLAIISLTALSLGFVSGDFVSANLQAGERFAMFLWTFSLSAGVSFLLLYFLIRPFAANKIDKGGDYGSASWATERQIKDSGLFCNSGIVVGAIRKFRKLSFLRYDGEGHVIVVSPTRSGKGVSIIVPTVLTWAHSILVNDIKGELWELTSGWRKKKYNSVCLRFDATCEDGSAARWNPLYEVRTYPHDVRDAHNIALTISASDSSSSRSDNERHWRVMGTRIVKAVILHQLYAGKDKTLPGCYRLLTSTNRSLEDTLLHMLNASHDPTFKYGWKDLDTDQPTSTHPAIAHIAKDMLSKSDKELSSIVSSAISYLEPFDDPIMASNVSESDFSLADLMNHEKPISLYLTTPVADLERVQTLHRLFFTLAGTRNTEHLTFKDGVPLPKYKHRLLMVFDECAHLGYSPVIQKHFSLASGYGIQGMFVFQDFSQLFDLYGRNESITSNCDIKITFAPNNIETAEYISRLLGTETREKKSNYNSKVIMIGERAQKQSFPRSLLTPDECLRLPRDKSIIIKNGFSPILGEKVPYYLVPELRERTKIPPAISDKMISGQSKWSSAPPQDDSLVAKVADQTLETRRKRKATTSRKRSAKPDSNALQSDIFSLIKTMNE